MRNKRGEKAYLINDIYRSSSTSKHQCCVRDAIPTGSKVFSVGYNMSNTGNMAFVTSRLESIKDAIEKYKFARTELPYQNVWGAFKNLMGYIEFFDMGTPQRLLNVIRLSETKLEKKNIKLNNICMFYNIDVVK